MKVHLSWLISIDQIITKIYDTSTYYSSTNTLLWGGMSRDEECFLLHKKLEKEFTSYQFLGYLQSICRWLSFFDCSIAIRYSDRNLTISKLLSCNNIEYFWCMGHIWEGNVKHVKNPTSHHTISIVSIWEEDATNAPGKYNTYLEYDSPNQWYPHCRSR